MCCVPDTAQKMSTLFMGNFFQLLFFISTLLLPLSRKEFVITTISGQVLCSQLAQLSSALQKQQQQLQPVGRVRSFFPGIL